MRNRGFLPFFRPNQRSQWSTLESGPLARTNSGILPYFQAKSEEPVVHSGEWTTGARAYGYFPVKVYRLIGTGAKPILSQISLDNYS